MALEAGQSLGSYECLAPLGAGGLGEVYRARDAKLGREVCRPSSAGRIDAPTWGMYTYIYGANADLPER